jgi:RNA polymerase sigma factor (sigma-70 family)
MIDRYKEEFLSGNETVFSQIYRLLSKDLYAYGLSFHAHHELIEDAIHDIFMSIYTNKKTLAKVEDLRHYLFRVFRNRLFFLIKQETLHIYMEETVYPDQTDESFEELWIEQETEAEQKARVDKLLKGLNVHQREVIHLRYMEGLSCEEVSNIMKIDVQSVKNLTFRAMKKIKAVLVCLLPLLIFN